MQARQTLEVFLNETCKTRRITFAEYFLFHFLSFSFFFLDFFKRKLARFSEAKYDINKVNISPSKLWHDMNLDRWAYDNVYPKRVKIILFTLKIKNDMEHLTIYWCISFTYSNDYRINYRTMANLSNIDWGGSVLESEFTLNFDFLKSLLFSIQYLVRAYQAKVVAHRAYHFKK